MRTESWSMNDNCQGNSNLYFHEAIGWYIYTRTGVVNMQIKTLYAGCRKPRCISPWCSIARTGGRLVNVNNEVTAEVWHVQKWCYRQCRLEGLKGSVGLHGPAVTLLEELSEGCRGGAQVLDEYPVVPREAKEAEKCPHWLGYWPVHHRLHLATVHRNIVGWHDVAQVCNRCCTVCALGLFEQEFVLL